MSLVEIRPLEKDRWHGKKGEESITRPQSSQVLVDASTHKYATGLTPEEAKEYGEKLGLDLSDRYTEEIEDGKIPYWLTNAAKLKFLPSTVIYDTDKPLEFVIVKNMMASKFVANSMKEFNEGLWPYATHVMHNAEQETELKASKIAIINKAMALSFAMPNDQKCDIIQIISNKAYRGKSQNFVDVEIAEIINEKPNEFIKYATKDSADLFLEALVLEAIFRNVLTKEGSGIYYMGDIIGHDINEAVKYFQNPNNQGQKVNILTKIAGGRKVPDSLKPAEPVQVKQAIEKMIEPVATTTTVVPTPIISKEAEKPTKLPTTP